MAFAEWMRPPMLCFLTISASKQFANDVFFFSLLLLFFLLMLFLLWRAVHARLHRGARKRVYNFYARDVHASAALSVRFNPFASAKALYAESLRHDRIAVRVA